MYLLKALKISNKVTKPTWSHWEYVTYDEKLGFTYVNGNRITLENYCIMGDNWEPYVDTGASDTPIPRKIVSLFHCHIDNSIRYYEFKTLEELRSYRDEYKTISSLVMAIWVDKINLIDTMIWEGSSK